MSDKKWQEKFAKNKPTQGDSSTASNNTANKAITPSKTPKRASTAPSEQENAGLSNSKTVKEKDTDKATRETLVHKEGIEKRSKSYVKDLEKEKSRQKDDGPTR